MKDFNITYQEMPKNIVAFYTKINDIKHIVVNTKHDTYTQRLGFFGCIYYQSHDAVVAKITIEDISKKDFEPIIYAKEKMKCFFKE